MLVLIAFVQKDFFTYFVYVSIYISIYIYIYFLHILYMYLGGKDSWTEFERLSYNGETSVVIARPHTGMGNNFIYFEIFLISRIFSISWTNLRELIYLNLALCKFNQPSGDRKTLVSALWVWQRSHFYLLVAGNNLKSFAKPC